MATRAPRNLPKSRKRCQFDNAVKALPAAAQDRLLVAIYALLFSESPESISSLSSGTYVLSKSISSSPAS